MKISVQVLGVDSMKSIAECIIGFTFKSEKCESPVHRCPVHQVWVLWKSLLVFVGIQSDTVVNIHSLHTGYILLGPFPPSVLLLFVQTSWTIWRERFWRLSTQWNLHSLLFLIFWTVFEKNELTSPPVLLYMFVDQNGCDNPSKTLLSFHFKLV